MDKQRLTFEKSYVIKLLVCAAILTLFWIAPPVAPITEIGMRLIGVFISVILLLSLVDTVWPAFLGIVLLSRSGICSLNEAIAGTLGSWVIYFVLMSFIMTQALNESGFTDRVVAKFMSIKIFTKTPWTFTFALAFLGLLLGSFMDQVPAAAFMLAFCSRIYKELGYEKGEAYPQMANCMAIFGVNIGGAMTPISHALVIIGISVYEAATGNTMSLFSYLAFGVPTGIVLFILMCIFFKIVFKPDMSNFKNFKIENVLKKQEPMKLKEKVIVTVFTITVLLWILPGVFNMFSSAAWVAKFNSYGITFWAILSIVVMSIIYVDNKPIVDTKTIVNKNINWGILIFISIGIYLGSAMSNEATGIVEAIRENIIPITQSVPPIATVLIIAFSTILLTNFASNVTAVTVMTGVSAALAMGSDGALHVAALCMTATMSGCCAYLFPSSFATVAMLHSDDYSGKKQIYSSAIIMIILTALIITFIGYTIGSVLMA